MERRTKLIIYKSEGWEGERRIGRRGWKGRNGGGDKGGKRSVSIWVYWRFVEVSDGTITIDFLLDGPFTQIKQTR